MDKQWQVHPSYVDVLTQISPEEGKILKLVVEKEADRYPMVTASIQTGLGVKVPVTSEWDMWDDIHIEHSEMNAVYLRNLVRLGIFTIMDQSELAGVNARYEELEKRAKRIVDSHPMMAPGNSYFWERKTIDMTIFGRQFLELCTGKAVARGWPMGLRLPR